jgi:hypothetical protein
MNEDDDYYTEPEQRRLRPIWAVASWVSFAMAFPALLFGLLGYVRDFPLMAVVFLGLGFFFRIITDRPVRETRG